MKITRRKFLETVAVSASTVAFGSTLVGCSDSDNNTTGGTSVSQSTFPQSVMSGDPREESVVFWTRVAADSGADAELVLQVSTSKTFATVVVEETLTALESHDHCLKVRVNGLTADTTYYYRFLSGSISTNIGRTKTAPAETSDRKVKFAFVSCQDFIGRYYNTYIRMLQDDMDDIDFIVHLGDYIYETSGDPSFQKAGSTRKVTFTGTGANAPLTLGSGESAFEAAQTTHNYRELYKTYRSDSVLQKVHELFPMVVIWDDHEFSDDSWQNNATYHGATTGEGNQERKQNAEQAFFEYIPIDQTNVAGQGASLAQGRIDVDTDSLSQGSVTSGVGSISDGVEIYRSLRFGQHLDLFLTDYRTHRPDHLIAEDAFPGTVIVVTSASTTPDLSSYVSLSSLAAGTSGALSLFIIGAYTLAYIEQGNDAGAAGVLAGTKAAAVMTGNLSHAYLTAVVEGAVAGGSITSPEGDALKADLNANIAGKALSYFTLGKTSLFSELGSRYLVIKEAYDALMGMVGSAAQNAYGTDQEAWLQSGLASSDATWRVLGSSVSLTSMILGLNSTGVAGASSLAGSLLDNDFYLNVDQWDGFGSYRATEVIPSLEKTANSPNGAISIAGDIHSSWVSKHGTSSDIMSFTCPSISSGTFHQFIKDQASSLITDTSTLDALLAVSDHIVQTSSMRQSASDKESGGEIAYNKMDTHGFGVAEVDGTGFTVTMHQMPPIYTGVDMVGESHYSDEAFVLSAFEEVKFNVADGVLTKVS